MDRTSPLIPIPGLIILIAVGLLALWLASRLSLRRKAPWLLPESAVIIALSTLHLLFFWQPYRSAAQVPAGGGDLASFFYPIHAFAAREIQAGRLPFWNPHQFGGMPHLANFQTGALYPPNLVAYLLSDPFSYAALERLALLHFLLASVGAYWLARSLGLDRLVSVVAGIVFAYSGFMAAHLGHYPMLVTAAWAPLVYAGLIGALRRDSWPLALGGTLALAMAILGGHQPMLLLVLSGAGLITFFELWRLTGYARPSSWTRGTINAVFRRAALKGAFILTFAVGLTLPALGPAFELAGYTSRSELSYQQASEFSVQPLALIHMVLPTVFGSNPTDYWGPFSNTEIWGYAGIATLILAGIGLVAGRGRSRFFWTGLLLLGLLYAIGPYSPLHGWLHAFAPGFDRMRGAGRAYFFVDLALAMLAAFGLARLMDRDGVMTARTANTLRFVERGILIAVGALVLFVIPLFASLVLGVNAPSNRPMIALDNLMMLTLWLVLTAGVIALARRNLLGGTTVVVLLGAIIGLDVFSVTARFNPTTAPILAGHHHPELVRFLGEQREEQGPFRIANRSTALQPDAARLHGFDAVGGLVDPLALESYEQFRRAGGDSAEFLSALNTRYIVTDVPETTPRTPGASVVLATERLLVWELPESRTRAWLAADPGRTIAVETPEPGRVILETDFDNPGGRLVVAQVDYPGWQATADGRTLPIETYQGTLQAVTIPEGEQSIELRFQPRYWTIWLAAAIVSGLIWAAVLLWTSVPPVQRKLRRDSG
ncbi:YfhO family protein [soil metagenome]